MERVQMRVVDRSIRGKGAGQIVSLSRRDARLLAKLGRVEVVEADDADAPDVLAEPTRRKTPKRGTAVKKSGAKKSGAKRPSAKKSKAKTA
jgi:hypothetical protein